MRRLEECRIAVRNVRRDLHNDMREFEKEKLISEDDLERGEEDLQKITDKSIEEINKHGEQQRTGDHGGVGASSPPASMEL